MDSLVLHVHDIHNYVDRLKYNRYFSLAGYSDAEWYCMFGVREGSTTGLGQVLSREHGKKLTDIMQRRQNDLRFLFSIPVCLWRLPEFAHNRINNFLLERGIEIEAYERDIILDDLAKEAGLFPLIEQLQKMNVVVIGNKNLKGLNFLEYKQFVEISSPNFHLEDGGIEKVVEKVIGWPDYYGPGVVYLVSAGVSAAVIIDQLHDEIPNAFFIDCGSIWDAFVGIGEQRDWRAKLYANPRMYNKWKRTNLEGGKTPFNYED